MSPHVGLQEKAIPQQREALQLLPVKFAWTSSVQQDEKLARTKQWLRTVSSAPQQEIQGQGDAQRPKKIVTFNLQANQVYFVEKYIQETNFDAGDSAEPRLKNADSQ